MVEESAADSPPAPRIGSVSREMRSARIRFMPWAFELSWVPKLRQWRKRRKVDGTTKTFYLGTGAGKHDRDSYARALAKWQSIEGALDKVEQQHQAFVDALEQFNAPLPSLKPEEVDQMLREMVAPQSPKRKQLDKCVDDYIEDQRRRYEHGLAFPNAPKRERISGVRFMSYRYNALLIKADWKNEPLPQDDAAMTILMKRFRENQKALMTTGKIAPGTVNERIKTLRHFVHWLHDQYLIPSLPRQIKDLCAMYEVTPTAKALDLDTIHALWNSASPRLRTYIALALNCGFYVGDIASLEYSHIQDGYIIKNRHKTSVPTRFLLWEVTKALLASNCNGKDRLALVTDDGGPLLVIDPFKNGNGKRWCKIETDLLALRKRLGINNVTFSKFRDTSSTRIESIDRTVTDLFDGHKDRRMARYYLDGDEIDYDRLFAALDKGIEELGRYYGLTV